MKIRFYPLAPSVFPEGTSLGGQMMKMLKLLGLMVFVVCIAAFASGCGGGGGGGSAMTPEEPPVVEPDPEPTEPTDAERIAAAIEAIAGILTDAQARAQATSSTAASIGLHPDVTDEHLANANIQNRQALDALAAIVTTVTTANTATTPAQAEAAVVAARTAYSTLVAAQSTLVAILSEVESPTAPTPPVQQPTDETQFTGGSPLIQHVRNNSIINEAVLATANMVPANLEVTVVDGSTNFSRFPVDTTTDGVATRGELSVTARGLSSATRGTTELPSISGIGSGFDMKGESGGTTTYVNAYTDISKAQNERVKTAVDGDTNTAGNQPTYEIREVSDADYLLLGIWLTVPDADTSASKMGAFAYGSRTLASIATLPKYDRNDPDIETDAELTAPTDSAVSFGITDFVDNNQDLNVTYRGKVTGAYLVGGKAAQLEASVELTAEFRNIGGTGEGDIGGTINNITAEGQSVDGYIDLVKKTGLSDSDTIGISAISDGVASGVVANQPYTGSWKGQFFEPRYTRTTKQGADDTADEDKTLYVYTQQAPGSFAGAFQVRKSGVGDAGIIGAFATRR